MNIKTTTNIDVDFYDKKYILVNAKQLDRGAKFLDEGVDSEGNEYSRWLDEGSRFFSVTCYYQGNLITFNSGDHAAYIRYRKPDGYAVYNYCTIDRFGKIIVALTEQMLAAEGICVADLVVIDKGKAKVDSNNGEIINIDDTFVLSTMPIHIDVTETAVNNSEIESTYEFNLLNKNMETYWANFEDVMNTSKSWAIGEGDVRDDEGVNNSKYWSEQSKKSANAASTSAKNAADSETKSNEYMGKALTYSQNAESYMNNANTYMDNAKTSEENAKVSENAAKVSETNSAISEANAKTSETNAGVSETNAKASEDKALVSEQNAKVSETSALNSANRAQSYAVGGTGTRDGEDTNNAQWYYNEIKDILNGLNIVFVPKGTIYFSELATVKETAVPGYIYNIKDDFVTDDSFREGSGVAYTAGTNVYYVIDENGEYKWDCFGGASSPVADVEEVKDYLGINEEIEIG